MAEPSGAIDWSKVKVEMALRVLQQGELHLKGQLDVMLASDRRALSIAALLVTLSSATIAASVALRAAMSPMMLAAALAASAMFLGAAVCHAWSAYYGDIRIPGNHPRSWFNQALLELPMPEAIGAEAENYQAAIDHNNEMICVTNRAQIIGCWIAAVAPVVGVAISSLAAAWE